MCPLVSLEEIVGCNSLTAGTAKCSAHVVMALSLLEQASGQDL